MSDQSPKKNTWKTIALWLLILVIVGYFALLIFSRVAENDVPVSEEFQKLMDLEKEWEKNPVTDEQVEEYMNQHPIKGAVFNLISLIMIGGALWGVFLDYRLFTKPELRQLYQRPPPAISTQWSLQMLLIMSGIWIGISLLINFLFFLADHWGIFATRLNIMAVLHTAFMDVFAIYLMVRIVQKYGGHWKDLGFHLEGVHWGREILTGVLAYFAILPLFLGLMVLLILIVKLIQYEPPAHPLVNVFLEEEKRAPWVVYFSIFLASFIGPIIEEVFFRGFCYPILKKKWGMKAGMILTGVIFAFIHQNEFAFLPILILGIGLCFVYEWRGNLIAPIALHIFHNAFFLTYFFLAKDFMQSFQSAP